MPSARWLLALCLLGVSAAVAEAAPRTWVGPDGGTWSTAANWSPSGPLADGDALTFPAGSASSHDDTLVYLLSVTFEGSHTLTGNGFFLLNGLTVSGTSPTVVMNVPVSAGSGSTWTIGAGATLTTASVTFTFAWNIANDGDLTVGGALHGDGQLTKSGAGTMTLASPNNFTGNLSIDQGTVVVQDPDGLGARDGTVANGTSVHDGAALVLDHVSSIGDEALELNGSGPAGGGALRLIADTPFNLYAPITLFGPTHVTADTGGASNEVLINTPITGGEALVILDTTTVVLQAVGHALSAIDFAGSSDGTLRLSLNDAYEGALTLPALATLDLNGMALTVTSLIGSGTIATTSGAPTLTVDTASLSTFSGTIGGDTSLRKKGAGALVLDSANTYTGSTIVEAGTLRVAHAQALGAMANTETTGTWLSGSAVLVLDGVSLANEWIFLAGPTTTLHVVGPTPVTLGGSVIGSIAGSARIVGTGGASLTLAGGLQFGGGAQFEGITVHLPTAVSATNGTLLIAADAVLHVTTSDALLTGTTVVVNGALHLDAGHNAIGGLAGLGTASIAAGAALDVTPDTTSTFSGTLSGSGAFSKKGNGVLTIGGPTTFTGPVSVAAGTLRIAHGQALAAAASFVVGTGGVLAYDVASNPTGTFTFNGFSIGTSNLQVMGGPVTFSGTTTFNSDFPSVFVAAPHKVTWQGPVTATRLSIDGLGTAVFGASGNVLTELYVGDTNTTNSRPTVRAGAAHALPPCSVIVAAGATFDLGGFDATLTSIAGPGQVALGAATLTLTVSPPGLYFQGSFSGTGAVVADLTGMSLVFDGTHTLTGTVTLTAGSFVHGGTLPAALLANGTGLTLRDGTVLGPLTMHGATAFVGDLSEPDGITTSGLTMTGESSLSTVVRATTPRMTVNGTVSVAGTLDLFDPPQPLEPGSSAVIIDNDGTDPVVGQFSNIAEGEIVPTLGSEYTLSYVGGTGNDVTITRKRAAYYLSEGATGTFFDTEVLIANPNDESVTAEVTFLPEQGTPVMVPYTLAPLSRLTILVDAIPGLESANVSTVVMPTTAVPLVVERTMRWDASGYGAHTEQATTERSGVWYFAEGSEGGFFRTFLLLANPSEQANVAFVLYLRENEPPLEREYALAPSSRLTIAMADDQELVNRSFGMIVGFDEPGVAERAMYFGTDPIWKGGHGSAGVTAASPTWLLAEGATGAGFDTFILIANPSQTPAEVAFTFLPESGEPATVTKTVAGLGRLSLNIEAEGLPIPEGPVATQISATLPVIAERAQYWPMGPAEWTEGHNSFGVTSAATRWGLAEGRTGGPEQYQTYILLANAGTQPATVTLQFLGDGYSTPPPARTVTVPAQRRVNVAIELPPDPQSPAATFGTLIQSDEPIVVERAMYWNAAGQVWAAGTNATGARLP